jgi:hypothetical protein
MPYVVWRAITSVARSIGGRSGLNDHSGNLLTQCPACKSHGHIRISLFCKLGPQFGDIGNLAALGDLKSTLNDARAVLQGRGAVPMESTAFGTSFCGCEPLTMLAILASIMSFIRANLTGKW